MLVPNIFFSREEQNKKENRKTRRIFISPSGVRLLRILRCSSPKKQQATNNKTTNMEYDVRTRRGRRMLLESGGHKKSKQEIKTFSKFYKILVYIIFYINY